MRAKSNSPSPAQRSVRAGARGANSYQFWSKPVAPPLHSTSNKTMAEIPPTLPPIPVVWIDAAKEAMASCTEALEESRVEDSWTIQTDSDWAKLVGKKLGIKRADGSYVRGWLCQPPGGAQGSALLRESTADAMKLYRSAIASGIQSG